MNRVFLGGRITSLPVFGELPSGHSVARFSLSTNADGRTSEHKIVAYRHAAEMCNDLLLEDFVLVEAVLQTRDVQSEADKRKGYKPKRVIEIVASTVEKLSRASTGEAAANSHNPKNFGEQFAESSRDSVPELPSFV